MAVVICVEVSAKGNTFKKISRHLNWSWRPAEVRATDSDLIRKFNNIASGSLPSNKIEKATEILIKLEKVENISDLMKMLSP
jgi:hypothetical protein